MPLPSRISSKREKGEITLMSISRMLTVVTMGIALAACAVDDGTPRHRSAAEPGSMDAAASAAGLDVGEGAFVSSDGRRLPLHVWGPEDAAIIAIGFHGLNDYGGAFVNPAIAWAQQGIRTYAYDQRGFGGAPGDGWQGHRVMVDDALTFLDLVRNRHPGAAVFLVGESVGAAIAVTAAAEADKQDVRGLVLAAPAIRPKSSLPVYQRALGWLAMKLIPDATVARDPLRSKATDNTAVLRAMAADPKIAKKVRVGTFLGAAQAMDAAAQSALRLNVPVLVLVGERDPVIDPALARDLLVRLEAAAIDTKLVTYDAGYHLLFRDRAGARPTADAMTWMTARTRREVAALSGGE